MIVRITAPHFCAGLDGDGLGKWEGAPILRYMKDWSLGQIKLYCKKKGWICEVIDPEGV
jgi:hypothetical protein